MQGFELYKANSRDISYMSDLNNSPTFSFSLIISSAPVSRDNSTGQGQGRPSSPFGEEEANFAAFEGDKVEILGYRRTETRIHRFKVLKMSDER